MDAYEIESLRTEIALLRVEHRDLDAVIEQAMESAPADMLRIQRLKKRKLLLKDQITRLENRMIPDIIA